MDISVSHDRSQVVKIFLARSSDLNYLTPGFEDNSTIFTTFEPSNQYFLLMPIEAEPIGFFMYRDTRKQLPP